MKTYFNRPETNVYIMIDDVEKNVKFIANLKNVKNILVISDTGAYSSYLTESSDNTKWVSVSEETFNSVVTSIESTI